MSIVGHAPLFAFAAPATWPYGLVPSFQTSSTLCKKVFLEASKLSPCRIDDSVCNGMPLRDGMDTGPLNSNEVLAYGMFPAYGYREVHALTRPTAGIEDDWAPRYEDNDDELAAALPEGIAILFLHNPGGRHHESLLETWKVNQVDLDRLLQLPLPPKDRHSYDFGQSRNASDFAKVLKGGELLSREISPVIAVDGKAYIVERECSGRWGYGYYACHRITKLTFKKVLADRRSASVCQLSRPKKIRKTGQ